MDEDEGKESKKKEDWVPPFCYNSYGYTYLVNVANNTIHIMNSIYLTTLQLIFEGFFSLDSFLLLCCGLDSLAAYISEATKNTIINTIAVIMVVVGYI